MPVLKGALQPDGALVDIQVAWAVAAAQQLRRALQPVPPAVQVQAILDTGAEATCLDTAVVQTLGLPFGGATLANVPAAGGMLARSQHDASLTILHPSGDPKLHYAVPSLLVIELHLRALGYDALIGRDVLDGLAFLYHGRRGRFRLSY
jgi:Aspartyl protease